MKNQFLLALAVFSLISGKTQSILASDTHYSDTSNAQARGRFSCSVDEITNYYVTTFTAEFSNEKKPIIFWSPILFDPKTDLEKRCRETAQILEKLENDDALRYLAAGYISDKPYICSVSSKDARFCENLIFEIDYDYVKSNSFMTYPALTEGEYAKYFLVNLSRLYREFRSGIEHIEFDDRSQYLESFWYHIQSGSQFMSLNNLDEAISNYKQALELIPRETLDFNLALLEAKARNNLGFALEKKQLFLEAVYEYRQSLLLDPSLSSARNNLLLLRRKIQTLPSESNPQLTELIPSIEQNPYVHFFRSTVMIEKNLSSNEQNQGGQLPSTGWVAYRNGNELFIVTCRHNLADKFGRVDKGFKVSFYSDPIPGQTYLSLPAELIREDTDLDISVLKVSNAPSDIRPLTIAQASQIKTIGQVWVVGHPSILEDPWQRTSGERTNYSFRRNFFSITAPIATGSSGSPVFDENNRLIGMVTAVVDQNSLQLNPNRPTEAISDVVVLGYNPQFGQAIRIAPIQELLERWQILPKSRQSQ